jgi:hypothetical protein
MAHMKSGSGKARTAYWAICALLFGSSLAAAQIQPSVDACPGQGTPTYTASRTVTSPGQTIKAKVFVSKGIEREETQQGGDTIVRITTPAKTVIFNTSKKTGVSMKPPAIPAPKVKPSANADVRFQSSTQNGETTTTMQAQKEGTWVDVQKVVCRADGALLRREFFLNVQGKPVPATLIQSDIEVATFDQAVFSVPNDVKIVEAPGAPPQQK